MTIHVVRSGETLDSIAALYGVDPALLGSANDWAEQMEDEEPQEITREQFMERMELESIEVRADGSFQFWFGDGDLFYGHSIWVSGDLKNGPNDAAMEG